MAGSGRNFAARNIKRNSTTLSWSLELNSLRFGTQTEARPVFCRVYFDFGLLTSSVLKYQSGVMKIASKLTERSV